jgi:hypothetical protein
VGLSGLTDDTPYFYTVEAEDEAGNAVTDDNGGACYTFTTPEVPDYFTEMFEGDNDLDNLSLIFTPNNSNDFYAGCAEEITELPTDPTGGTTLSFSSTDDGYSTVTLTGGAQVSLYGTAYGNFYVGTNGYITFGASDTDYSETLADHFDTPRVSGLFDDLHTGHGGLVSWKQLADRAVVTWEDIPEFYDEGSNTFQIELYFDGTIVISYLSISAADGIAGLSEGDGLDPDFWETDLSAMSECEPPDCNENGVPDGDDIAGGTSEDCNGNFVPDECDIADSTSEDCNENSVPDECDLSTGFSEDCNGNLTPDECDIAGGVSGDADGNGVPDECEVQAPSALSEGSRYLVVTALPADLAVPMALLVTGDPSDPSVSCVSLYVQEDHTLGSAPVYKLPSAWGAVHIQGDTIMPTCMYRVQAELTDGYLSDVAEATTWRWGDVDCNTVVNLADVMLIVSGYQGDFSEASLENMDQAPCVPNQLVNLDDVMGAITAFQGGTIRADCPPPCP